MNNINLFYNSPMFQDVKDYLDNVLVTETQKRVFARQDISGIADAKEILDKAFQNMANEFGVKKQRQVINEAE